MTALCLAILPMAPTRLFATEVRFGAIDCGHAKPGIEAHVCGAPELSQFDRQLGGLYRQRSALLSPSGVKLLEASQLSWAHFVETVCSADLRWPWRGETWQTCLARAYSDRLEHLKGVAQRVGPFLFNRVDLYFAERSHFATDPDIDQFNIEHVAYPQIDMPVTADITAWNKNIVPELPKSSDPQDHDADHADENLDQNYKITYATSRWLSISWDGRSYAHGAMHGHGWSRPSTFVAAPNFRPLRSEDLFGPGDGWKPSFKAHVWSEIEKTHWHPHDEFKDYKEELEYFMVMPDWWEVTKAGLKVDFPSLDGRGYYGRNPEPVTLTWSRLRPLLSKTAAVP